MEISSALEPGEKMDYNKTKTMYEKFWSKCQDYFDFEVDKKFSVSINQIYRAPKHWTICEYKEQGIKHTLYFLVHMLNSFVKQTLCVMPDTEENPTDWEQIKDEKFFIINGQHNVAASQKIKDTDLPEKIVQPFLNWNCFIIWSKDKNWWRQILGYCNRCNHLGVFKSTWATNVLGARFIYTKLGRPKPLRFATEIGRAVRRTKKDATNDAKYKINNKNYPPS